MRKQLTRIGSSLGIIIDKPILQLLNITAETELEMETDGRSLTLRPVRLADASTARAAYRKAARRHKKSLAKLAN